MSGRSSSSTPSAGWSHTPSTLILLWMAISLPLVAWDTGYVLLRPLSMPGGSLHWPLWVPYELYGEIDHMYGFKQWNLHNGFTAAQSVLNVIESLMYAAYLGLWCFYGEPDAQGARKTVRGRAGALALLLGFSGAVMTVSKTVLYWLNEYFSGFDNIGHNTPLDLFFLWIIPNGAWIFAPSILMVYGMGREIIAGLVQASNVVAHNVKQD
ncbi:C6 transcription factor [Madurella fahalii]|uniref:C6 transcription factor n=1 Tax=Madurella fahalii TaxID=1157608 RepID=A0ABQ0GQ22_9PEZI